MLELLMPLPRKLEVDSVDVAAPATVVWEHVRHGDLAASPLARALFALRTLPSRLAGGVPEPGRVRIDDLRSSPERPGFQVLGEDPPRELVAGAIGQVWQLDIPFTHVDDAEAFAAFAEPGWVKVAWALRVTPLGEQSARVSIEVRVDATDDASWDRFRRYWRLIGPGSHFIRHAAFAGLVRRFGSLDGTEERRGLTGDDLLVDASAQITHAVTIAATPEAIWPWLVQMGCHRAGYYSIDALDNGGVPSAREIHPELQRLAVGDVLPAAPDSDDGFEVLSLDPFRALVLGGLFDGDQGAQLAFTAPRPPRFWQVTWAFILEAQSDGTTRLHARARAAFSPTERLHAAWIRPVHSLMQTAQLRNLAARAEGRLARDTWRDVASGLGGAAIMALAWLTPFLRSARSHWGLTEEDAARPRPGDELLLAPRWSWTHAVNVDAPAEVVWPWVAQLGADRAGFYSYQWLENLAGCDLRNADAIHPEWAHASGDDLVLHPEMPPLPIVSVEPGRHLIAWAPPDERARAEGRPWAAASWALIVEPDGADRCRVVSRFRTACSDDLKARLTQGPFVLEPVGFAMDRRMLLGIRARAMSALQAHS